MTTTTDMIDPEHITAETLLADVRDMRRQLNWLLTDYKRAGRVFNEFADLTDTNMKMIDENIEKSDNVFELILRHLGVDMSEAGDPPTMTAEEIGAQLAAIRDSSERGPDSGTVSS